MRVVVPASETSRPETACRIFFKADHLRTVDRYIDYFGASGQSQSPEPLPAARGLKDVAPVVATLPRGAWGSRLTATSPSASIAPPRGASDAVVRPRVRAATGR